MSDDQNLDETTPSDLRKMYEKMKAQLDAAEAKVQAFESEKRTATVSEQLKAAGVSPLVAKFYSGDGSESDVSKWLEENKELFPAATSAPVEGAVPVQGSVVDPNSAAAQRLADVMAAAGTEHQLTVQNGRVIGDPAALQQMMARAPRTPEGYKQLVDAGLMPADPRRI
jgi:hypothetical protein